MQSSFLSLCLVSADRLFCDRNQPQNSRVKCSRQDVDCGFVITASFLLMIAVEGPRAELDCVWIDVYTTTLLFLTGHVMPPPGTTDSGSDDPPSESSDTATSDPKSYLVMSGGEGYIDFRLGE